MTTLGEILNRLSDRSEIYQILAESGDMRAISKLRRIVDETGDDPCEIALRAVRIFSGKADDEAWTKLIGCVQNAPSPASACLGEMIAWSMGKQSI
jgi:hypothetical protein